MTLVVDVEVYLVAAEVVAVSIYLAVDVFVSMVVSVDVGSLVVALDYHS